MKRIESQDTIVAIATPLGESGIGIVRMSGRDAIDIADKVFQAKDKSSVKGFGSYTVHYGWIVENNPSRSVVDEVLLTVMRAPRSYTREDVVEINCHGGIVALGRVLDLLLGLGCRPAEPGEFTRRAFLNGRIDLAQAEAVLEIVRAKTDVALRLGVEQLKGALSGQLQGLRDTLLETLAVLEAGIDFPEEETEALSGTGALRGKLREADAKLRGFLSGAASSRVFREGVRVVICGRPNVGKSSLLNALLRQERSIVTGVAGTTRDTVEEAVSIRGIPVALVDTAGIVHPRGQIERKAVERSRRSIALADVVILLFDGSQRLSAQDKSLMRRLGRGQRRVLAAINKSDLRQRIEKEIVSRHFPRLIEISARRGRNIQLLEDALAEMVHAGAADMHEPMLLVNRRHTEKMRRAQKLIAEAADSMDNNKRIPPEFIAQNIKDALRILDEILGRSFSEDVLDRIFSRFCIGK